MSENRVEHTEKGELKQFGSDVGEQFFRVFNDEYNG